MISMSDTIRTPRRAVASQATCGRGEKVLLKRFVLSGPIEELVGFSRRLPRIEDRGVLRNERTARESGEDTDLASYLFRRRCEITVHTMYLPNGNEAKKEKQ